MMPAPRYKLGSIIMCTLTIFLTACDFKASTLSTLTPTSTPVVSPTLSPTFTHTPTFPSQLPTQALKEVSTTVYDTWVRPTDGAEMVFVPGGSFLMGSSEVELQAVMELWEQYRGEGHCRLAWFENEMPQHKVTLDSYWIDRTEVTNAQYNLCVEAGICRATDC